VDAFEDLLLAASAPTLNKPHWQQTVVKRCLEIRVDLSFGKSLHMSYPFGIHDKLGDLWDYTVIKGVLVLCSKHCMPNSLADHRHCQNCKVLVKNPNLEGILQHMEMGVHENTSLVYHSVGSFVTLLRRK
jgi:hypothetical protein